MVRSEQMIAASSCPCLEEFCNFFPAIFGICCQKLKKHSFCHEGRYLFFSFFCSRISLASVCCCRVTDTGRFGQRKGCFGLFYELCCWNRQLLNGSSCENSGKAVSHCTQRILLQVRGCKLATLNLLNRFQLNCSESSWPDPVKHSACHLPDNTQSLFPSNTFDSVCVFGHKK